MGCSGGEALGAPLWVALPFVKGRGQWNGGSSDQKMDPPTSRSDLIPYIMR
jgi:hypothetical protein